MLDSEVEVTVRGAIVEADVTQTFRNDTDRPTEATYIFPLPLDAAVTAMAIHTGTRTIHAAIESREHAAERYERAVAAGASAALLDQERPDVFTQTVSAIPARGVVQVTLRYDTTARYTNGQWELAVPLVVAPRYVPGSATGRPTTGGGRAPDTDRAPDASRITPRSAPGAGGKTTIHLHFAGDVADVTSPTHRLDDNVLVDPHSDHDAVIRWRAKLPEAAWVEDDGYAAVVVEAPAPKPRTGALHALLVLDRSATTRGDGDTTERPLVDELFRALTAGDHLDIDGARSVDELWARPAGAFDLARVLEAIHTRDPIVLVTDGLVADDAAVLAAGKRIAAPIHVVGIGPAPNRSLLTHLASETGGTVRFAVPGDSLPELARDVLADAASSPEPLAISWGTLGATDVVPATMPRLGAHQAALVLARVKKPAAGNARVQGDVIGFMATTTPHAPEGATTPLGPLARRWAREKLDELIAAGNPRAVAAHALRFGLVSPQTSMVAIADDVVVEGGVKHTTTVPVSVPAGMRWQLVEKATHVDVGAELEKHESANQKEGKKAPVTKGAPREEALDDNEDKPKRKLSRDEDGDDDAREAPTVAAAPPPAEATGSVMAEDIEVTGVSYRRHWLTLGLGTGVSVVNGHADAAAALVARHEHVLPRGAIGVEGSVWFVGGLHAQGSLLATGELALSRHVDLGLGGGLRLTGTGVGPALGLALRVPLVHSLRLYLRYDGALLLHDGTVDGQNVGTAGLETSW
jgi:Ca-activated chloride channel family protein